MRTKAGGGRASLVTRRPIAALRDSRIRDRRHLRKEPARAKRSVRRSVAVRARMHAEESAAVPNTPATELASRQAASSWRGLARPSLMRIEAMDGTPGVR
jgi:hypothetical protein